MKDVVFALPGIALTIVCWGAYGAVLHKGQAMLGDRLKPLMCVGLAYVIFAIVLPTLILSSMGKLGGNWNFGGVSWSTMAGTCGAFGALGIILGALKWRQTNLCDAAGFRWCSHRQRGRRHVFSGIETSRRGSASAFLLGRRDYGGDWGGDGIDFRAKGPCQRPWPR